MASAPAALLLCASLRPLSALSAVIPSPPISSASVLSVYSVVRILRGLQVGIRLPDSGYDSNLSPLHSRIQASLNRLQGRLQAQVDGFEQLLAFVMHAVADRVMF